MVLGFGVWGLGFGGFGFRVCWFGGLVVQGLGFGVWGLGAKDLNLTSLLGKITRSVARCKCPSWSSPYFQAPNTGPSSPPH